MSCSHVSISRSIYLKSDLIRKSQGKCDLCGLLGPNLWACLQEGCDFVGCGESGQDHGTQHVEKSQHFVSVNLKTFRLWCYGCNKEIKLPAYFTAKEMKLLKKNSTTNSKQDNSNLQPKTLSASSKFGSSFFQNSHQTTLGLTGLRNLGNTCYMNAALQSLSNCPQLTKYFLTVGKYPASERKNTMTRSYYNLTSEMWDKRQFASFSPSAVLSTLKMINPMFRGYQQQDTQEFLRCIMDRLHEETKYFVDPQIPREAGDAPNTNTTQSMNTNQNFLSPTLKLNNSLEESFETCSSNHETNENMDVSEPMIQEEPSRLSREFDQLHASGFPLHRSSSMPSIHELPQQINSGKKPKSMRKRTVSSMQFESPKPGMKPRNLSPDGKESRSIISDIFDGALRSSVQCKMCFSLSHTRETFQDLSLPIPGKDDVARLHSSIPPSENERYNSYVYGMWEWLKSWFWGPDVTLSDCLSAFFSSDELKGDNMYSCEKCKKLRNGIKYCRLLKLPEVLCIHLKRFRHEYLTSYSTKISSTVTFPLHDLNLSRYTAPDKVSENTNYNLSSVIVHHGGAGDIYQRFPTFGLDPNSDCLIILQDRSHSFTFANCDCELSWLLFPSNGGHYTSYCKNPMDGNWYEFDDQYVTQVSESTVTQAEAYVLFYSKSNVEMDHFREKVLSLEQEKEPVLMKFYIAAEWLSKFLTFAEPGQINNNYFLCSHGNCDPSIYDEISERVCCVSEQTWHMLHKRFGGGPSVTRIQPCQTCILQTRLLEERRLAEKEMYMKLSGEDQENEPDETYYISMEWFRKWQDFICSKEKYAPGEIDNFIISEIVGDNKIELNKGSDYGEINANAWKYLHSQYGGGPVLPNLIAMETN